VGWYNWGKETGRTSATGEEPKRLYVPESRGERACWGNQMSCLPKKKEQLKGRGGNYTKGKTTLGGFGHGGGEIRTLSENHLGRGTVPKKQRGRESTNT